MQHSSDVPSLQTSLERLEKTQQENDGLVRHCLLYKSNCLSWVLSACVHMDYIYVRMDYICVRLDYVWTISMSIWTMSGLYLCPFGPYYVHTVSFVERKSQ